MRTLKIFLSLVILPFTAVTAYGQIPSTCPPSKGAYYLKGNEWAPMDRLDSIGFKTTNVAGAAFSYGMAKAHLKAIFRDSESPYQLKGNQFAMCLVGITDSGRDVSIARFQQKKNRRELPMASYRLWTGYDAQIDPKSIIPISVDKKADELYVVTTKGPLPHGEFVLFTIIPDIAAMIKANAHTSLGGYDFGNH